MKEFIEKLIGSLEESVSLPKMERMELRVGKKQTQGFGFGVRSSVKIVNQLAEEYNNKSVKGDLISRSALIDVLNAERKQDRSKAYGEHECDLIAGTIAMCTDFVKAMPTENDGWIPCSDRLPEEDEKVIVSTKTDRVQVGIYTKGYGFNMREGFICDDGFMWMNVALAWQPLPAPYQPKGE